MMPKLILLVLAIGLLLFVGLYLSLNYILMALAAPLLEERQADLELERISVRAEGVHIYMTRYEEPGLVVESAVARMPLRALLNFDHFSELSVQCEKVFVDLDQFQRDAEETPKTTDVSVDLGAQCAQLSSALGALPLELAKLEIEALTIRYREVEHCFVLESSFDGIASGDVEFLLSLKGEWLDADVKLWSFADSAGLGLDYTLRCSAWEPVVQLFAPTLIEQLKQLKVDLYLDPIREHAPLLDISGYVRWNADSIDEVRSTALANLGPIEIFGPDYDLSCAASAFGFATDGRNKHRAFMEVPIETLRYGTLQRSEGLLEIALKEGGLELGLDFPDADSLLSLKHKDWKQALAGEGDVSVAYDDGRLSHETIRSFAPEQLPADMNLEAKLEADLTVTLAQGRVRELSGDVAWRDASLESTVKGVQVDGFSGALRLTRLLEPGMLGSVELGFKSASFVGLGIGSLKSSIHFLDTDSVSVQGGSFAVLGGQLEFEDFVVDRKTMAAPKVALQMRGVDLDQLAQKVPQFEGEVSGQISGELTFGWSPKGLFADGGMLELDRSIPAHLSYQLHGLLTQGMNPSSSSFEQYKMAERAFEDLNLKRLSIELFPDANPNQPVRLQLYGESQQQGIVVPVDYTLNVNVDDTAGLLQLLQMMQRGELQFN